MELSTSVLMVIFAFTFIPLLLAEIARASSLPTVNDFFLQQRSMPTVMVFFTVYATWVSSFAFLGSASYFYNHGPLYMTAFGWNLLFALLFMVIGKRIWFYGKVNNYITPVDFFSDIYRLRSLDIAVTLITISFTIPYLMIQLSGGAFIIETATYGLIPWRVSGFIFYLIIIIYLWAGGLRAVALTDIFYGIMIFSTMLIAGFLIAAKAGGINHVFEYLQQTDPDSLVLKEVNGWNPVFLWLGMFIVVPIGALMGPQMWIRAYAAKNNNTFNIMPLLILMATIMYLGPLLAGTSGKVLAPDLVHADNLVPFLLASYAPPLLGSLLLCGIAAAALSTANSQIHALSAIYTIDIHKKYINTDAPERSLVNVGKWAVLVVSFFAYILLIKAPSLIIETGTIGMSGTAQLIVPTIGALFWKHSNGRAALFGLLGGTAILLVLIIATEIPVVVSAVIALIINLCIFIPLSIFLPTDMGTRTRIIENKLRYLNRFN